MHWTVCHVPPKTTTNKTISQGTVLKFLSFMMQLFQVSSALDCFSLQVILLGTEVPDSACEHASRGPTRHIIYAEFNIAIVKKKQVKGLIPLYNKADWDSLREGVNKLGRQVQEMKSTTSREELWTCFKTTLQSATEKNSSPTNKHGLDAANPGLHPSSDISLIKRTYKKWKKTEK